MISNVYEFNQKFGLPLGTHDQLDEAAQEYRLKFLHEELEELEEALNDGDAVKAFDALLDLCYVAYGTALFMGIDPAQWHAGMTAVHHANMTKVRAAAPTESKRGTTLDVIKPADWTSPEGRLKEILSWGQPQLF